MPYVQHREVKADGSPSHGSSDEGRTGLTTFVLLAGAWHGGWCWERVVPLLEAAGHCTIAPDLLGMGSDSTPLDQVTLAGWADQVTNLIARESDPVILVGHSRAGIVISEVAERIPERIQSLVYLTAALVPNGETSFSTREKTLPEHAEQVPLLIAKGAITLPREAVRRLLYNTTGSYWAARAEDRLGGEPASPMNTPLRLSEQRFGAVRRAFIECTEDRVIPLAAQRAMQKIIPCEPVISLGTDHSSFYSDPEALTSALISIDRQTRDFSHQKPMNQVAENKEFFSPMFLDHEAPNGEPVGVEEG